LAHVAIGVLPGSWGAKIEFPLESALAANSLCPKQEKRMMRELEVQAEILVRTASAATDWL
jgi:hypothetical protein